MHVVAPPRGGPNVVRVPLIFPIRPVSPAVYRPLKHVTHHSHLSNRSFVFPTNASTPVPLLAFHFDLHRPACCQPSYPPMHIPLLNTHSLGAHRPLTFRYLREKTKSNIYPKSPLGVRVVMYRNVLCSFFHSIRLLGQR